MKNTELTIEKIGDKYAEKNNHLIQKFYEAQVLSFDEISKVSLNRLIRQLTQNIIECLLAVADYAYERELYEAQKRKRFSKYHIDDELLLMFLDGEEIKKLIEDNIKEYMERVKYTIKSGRDNKIPLEEIKNILKAQTGTIGECGLTYRMMRILRTESNATQAKASMQAYEDAGVESYMYHAILDNRACEICQDLDGEVFPVKDAQRGENLPPIHPNCRCYTTPLGRVKYQLSFEGWRKRYLK